MVYHLTIKNCKRFNLVFNYSCEERGGGRGGVICVFLFLHSRLGAVITTWNMPDIFTVRRQRRRLSSFQIVHQGTNRFALTWLRKYLQCWGNPEIRIGAEPLSSKSLWMIYCSCCPSQLVCKGTFYIQRLAHKSAIPSITLCSLTSSLLNIRIVSYTLMAQIIL